MKFEWQKPDYVLEKLNSVGCGFCLAKWTQVTMHLGSGLTHSCHHPKAHPIDLNDLATNPKKICIRPPLDLNFSSNKDIYPTSWLSLNF